MLFFFFFFFFLLLLLLLSTFKKKNVMAGVLHYRCWRPVRKINSIVVIKFHPSNPSLYPFTSRPICPLRQLFRQPEKPADNPRRHHWFPRKMTSELMTRQYQNLGSDSDWLKIASSNQKPHPGAGDDKSSEWNFWSLSSDVISRGKQWWHREMSAAFPGFCVSSRGGRYSLRWLIRGASARTGYLFQTSGTWKGTDFTTWSI